MCYSRAGEGRLPVSLKFLTGRVLLSSLVGCSDSASESKVAPKAALPVEIFTVENQSAEREINAVGTVRYRRETPLGFTTQARSLLCVLKKVAL